MVGREDWFIYRGSRVVKREYALAPELPPRNALLFLHGRSEDARCWHGVVEKLQAQSYPALCISIDLPGMGRSFWKDPKCAGEASFDDCVQLFAELIRISTEAKPESRWLLAGHDLGALIVQLAALEVSARHAKTLDLVLINPISLSPPQKDESEMDAEVS